MRHSQRKAFYRHCFLLFFQPLDFGKQGSWQRALLHQSLGLPVDDADAKALAKWDRNPVTLTWTQCMNGVVSKYTLLHQEQRVIGAVTDAATTVLSPSEVVGSRELARRIAGMPGMPHHNRTMAMLKATGPSSHEVHMLQGGTTRRRMYKRYIDNLSGRPVHFLLVEWTISTSSLPPAESNRSSTVTICGRCSCTTTTNKKA